MKNNNYYEGILLEYYRHRYSSMQELILSSDEFPFCGVKTGQPVCSVSAIYNMEEGKTSCHGELGEYVIGKLGFELCDCSDEMNLLRELAEKLTVALRNHDHQRVKAIWISASRYSYERYFLLSVYHSLILSACRFYLFADLQIIKVMADQQYPEELFGEPFTYIYNFVMMYYHLFGDSDYAQAVFRYEKLRHPDINDLLVLVGCLCSDAKVLSLLKRRVAGLSDGGKFHELWLSEQQETVRYFTGNSDQKPLRAINEGLDGIRCLRHPLIIRQMRMLRMKRNWLMKRVILSAGIEKGMRDHGYKYITTLLRELID